MPIALNEFMTGVENGQLKLEDGHSGNPVIVQANFSFADKVMQWLTQIPLLSDMKSVQAFVEKETQGNLRTLGVFLNALAHEYGDKFADNVASGLDMSGQTPLTARQIRDITQQAPHSEVTTQDVISQDEQVLEVPERTTHLVSQVMPDIKPAQRSQLEKASQVLSGCQSPMDLPTPTSLSMFNFFSYESVEMSEVQNQVKNYNQIVKDSSIMATANLLAQASNNHLSPEKVGEAIASLSDDIAAVKSGIESIEQASQAVPEAEQENLAALKRAMRSELSRLEKIETMTNQFSDAWDVESQSYKDVHDFYLSCSETLQASLTPELTLLCYEMIDNSPNHNRETLVNRLADKLVEYASDMASVNLRTLADALSEKVPQLANDVKTPFLQPEHKAQLGAINLINQALSQSKERLKLEQQGVEARLEIPQKLQALRHSAAIFTEQTQAYFRQETDLDMHFDATLLALTGQSFVAKGDELVADFEVELRELALEDSILEQLEDLDLDETSRMLAEDVLQTQHKMNWLDQENSYTKEVNNGVDVNLRRDVETRQLADNISQNSQRYGSYLGAKISATQDYIVALDALSKANISEGVTSQVNVVKGEAQGQLDRLSELESKRLVWQQAEDTKVLLNNKLARLDTMIGQTIDSDTKRLNLRGFLSYLKPIKANNDKVCVLAVRQSELEAQLPRLEKALNDRFGSTWEQALNENQDNALVKDYQGLTTVIDQVKSQIKTLDKDYERSMLQLTQFDRQVMKDGGYPDVSGNSMEAWSAWMKQNVAGSWSEDHRPDISSLILERQMAKNGISGYAEAYQALYQTLSSHSEGLDSGDSAGVMKALGDLHNWAMAHPIESQALAGNLTHAYQIVAGNSGWFGADLATVAKTVWKTSTVENQVKDILQGRREFLPTEKSMTMSAEMIALLHLAQCAPYVAGAVKGAAGGGLVANAAGTLAGAVVPGGGILAGAMARMVGGLLQTASERQISNVVSRHRTTEVMVNALMTGIQAQGSFNERAKAVASYAMKREALQDVGTLARDCYETNKATAISRLFQDAKNTWDEMNWKARTFTVATVAVTTVGAAALAALTALAIVGTGGLALVAVAVVGAAAAPVGAYAGKTLLNVIAASNFLGMQDARQAAKDKMTQQRIDQALERLGEKPKDGKLLGDMLGDSIDRFRSIKVSQLPDEEQSNAFVREVTKIASQLHQSVTVQNQQSRSELIAAAKEKVPMSLQVDNEQWEECLAKVDLGIEAYA